jgi:hypothetical protein
MLLPVVVIEALFNNSEIETGPLINSRGDELIL